MSTYSVCYRRQAEIYATFQKGSNVTHEMLVIAPEVLNPKAGHIVAFRHPSEIQLAI